MVSAIFKFSRFFPLRFLQKQNTVKIQGANLRIEPFLHCIPVKFSLSAVVFPVYFVTVPGVRREAARGRFTGDERPDIKILIISNVVFETRPMLVLFLFDIA